MKYTTKYYLIAKVALSGVSFNDNDLCWKLVDIRLQDGSLFLNEAIITNCQILYSAKLQINDVFSFYCTINKYDETLIENISNLHIYNKIQINEHRIITENNKWYSNLLKTPEWKSKRKEIFDLKGEKCENCNKYETGLHLHHLYYIKKRNPWEYPNSAFQILCSECHNKWHINNKIIILNN